MIPCVLCTHLDTSGNTCHVKQVSRIRTRYRKSYKKRNAGIKFCSLTKLSNMTNLRIQFDDDFLVCVICEKLLNEPRLLPCLHSVCLSCAQSALVGSIMKIRCLKCKEYVTVSDSKNIHSNQWLQNVIDIMNISECLYFL